MTTKAQDKKEEQKAEEKLPLKKRFVREVVAWAWVIAAFLLIHGTLLHGRVIPSPSMEETLLVGDHLLVYRFGYDAEVPFTGWHVTLWREPERQQMIVFRSVKQAGLDLVKRVIGVPGDTVEIRAGAVWLNGRPLAEPYVTHPADASEQYGPVEVPEGHFFVLGDNRDNSYDSRYWGFVPRENVVGTPLIIYMSLEGPGDTWQSAQVSERLLAYAGAIVNPTRVRWQRLFTTF